MFAAFTKCWNSGFYQRRGGNAKICSPPPTHPHPKEERERASKVAHTVCVKYLLIKHWSGLKRAMTKKLIIQKVFLKLPKISNKLNEL